MNTITSANPNNSLVGRVALVTGAARGIGEAIARELHQNGAKVVVTDVDADGAQAVASSLDPSGDSAIGLALDVRRKEDFERALERTTKRWNTVDIVVNNAGYAMMMFRRTMPQIVNPGGLWDTAQKIYPHVGARSRSHPCTWRCMPCSSPPCAYGPS